MKDGGIPLLTQSVVALDQVQSRIEDALAAFGSAREVMTYIASTAGKKLRPSLVLLTFDLCGGKELEQAIHVAAGVELVHMASLIHDDIIDHSELRRGQTTVHRRFGNQVAVLAGDHLFAAAFRLFSVVDDTKVVKAMTEIIKEMCLGEMNQFLNPLTTERVYWDYIHKKTARLVGGCSRLGGILAGAGAVEAQTLDELGTCIGLAFQLTDDVLDYRGNDRAMGKRPGRDFYEGVWTLPVLRAHQQGLLPSHWAALSYSEVQGILERENILSEIWLEAVNQLEKAKAILRGYPSSLARSELESLIESILRRES